MQKLFFSVLIISVFASCASNSKRIIIMSKGTATVNEEAKTITAKDGTGHEEKVLNMSGADIQLKLNAPAGEASVALKDNGLYIINVKNDTIIGSLQSYSSPKTQKGAITQDELKQKIDSLHQLVEAKNISTANHNFFILPNQAVKISDNIDAFVVGPYHQMTTVEKVGDKTPEVYRFFSIKEVRENILKLEALTKPTSPDASKK